MKRVSVRERRAGGSVELILRKSMVLGPLDSPHGTIWSCPSLSGKMKQASQGFLPSEMGCVCVKVLFLFGGFVVIAGDPGLTQIYKGF